MSFQSRIDVYQKITSQVVAQLEAGARPWFKPWQSAHVAGNITRPLRANGQPYRGINVFMLWGEADAKGYSNPTWMTFKQAQEYGACVRKGEHGSLVVYADKIVRTETREDGSEETRAIPFLKGYTVFNVEQIDGLPEKFTGKVATPETMRPIPERIATAETFFRNTGAEIREQGSRACYIPSLDQIHMPPLAAFQDAEYFYSTLAHEAAHWTWPEKRLNRDFGRKRWGDEGYAMEELVAELASCYLAADLGIEIEPRADHASYLQSWLKVLKGDKRAIFSAATHAQAAADYLHSLQAKETLSETLQMAA